METSKAKLRVFVRNVTGHAHMDKHRKLLGDFGDTKEISETFLNHINGGEPPRSKIKQIPKDNFLNIFDMTKASSYGACKL